MTFPSKLSFYITFELPILSIDSTETARILSENKIGISCSLNEMAKNLRLLCENHKLRNILKQNCRMIKEYYFWDSILADAFEAILQKR